MDKPKTELTDGNVVTEDHRELKSNGQQKGYVVLTKEELAKGFIRPVRDTYVHVGIQPKHPLRDLTQEEKGRYGIHYGKDAQYEEYPEDEGAVVGRIWTQKQLSGGCGNTTTMSQAIAETYARDPKFYGATFCHYCNEHLPVSEFVWRGTIYRVGS